MIGQASDPMLAKVEQGIQDKIPQNRQADLAKIVHAGLTIMYSPQIAQQRNAHLAASKDPVKDAGDGATRLIVNLYQQSKKTMPTDMVVPAAMIFAFEYLDLLAKSGKLEITPDIIAHTTTAVADSVLPAMGITKEKLAELIAQSKQGGAQPPAEAAPAPAAPSAPAPPAGIIGGAQAAA